MLASDVTDTESAERSARLGRVTAEELEVLRAMLSDPARSSSYHELVDELGPFGNVLFSKAALALLPFGHKPGHADYCDQVRAIDTLAGIDAESQVQAVARVPSSMRDRIVQRMKASGYRMHDNSGDAIDPSPSFTFKVSAIEALRAEGWVSEAPLALERAPAAPTVRRSSARLARSRQQRTRSGARTATRGDPSRPRPADDDDLARHHAEVAG